MMKKIQSFVLWGIFHSIIATYVYFNTRDLAQKNGYIDGTNQANEQIGRDIEKYYAVLMMNSYDGWVAIDRPTPEELQKPGWERSMDGSVRRMRMADYYPQQPQLNIVQK